MSASKGPVEISTSAWHSSNPVAAPAATGRAQAPTPAQSGGIQAGARSAR
ncbi:hypothetical protein Areg01_54520 [Actinoplanes regularis]|nr:hypothetical protein Areg01_54520 [Actinoplanes regularis]